MKKIFPVIIISIVLSLSGCVYTLTPSAPDEYTQAPDETDIQNTDAGSTAENGPDDDGGLTTSEFSVSGNDAAQNEPEEPEPVLPQTVTILGEETDVSLTSLDLSGMTPEDVESVAEALTQMQDLAEVNLMDEEGLTQLSLSDVARLKESAPDTHFIYEFDFYGQTVSTSDAEVIRERVAIGNDGEENVRNALTILDRCEYFLLDDCGIDDEVMDSIRSDYPDTKVVWRIHVGTRSALTDDQVIRMTHGINDSMTGPLKYCHEVVYMDLGHDAGITDISFIEMPLLECIILSDAKMTDISPLANCPNLTWVELVYCDRLGDITPITGLESVKYINISYSGIRDITPLYDMNLDRLCLISIGVSDEQLEEYRESHPDTLAINSGNPYGYAWRYNDYGYHFFWYYARMREAFRYDQGSPGGFKLPDEWINYPPEEETDDAANSEDASDADDAENDSDAEEP
ncbi:MAG: hypothetical protein K5871_05585 [Lachnospiraceae bacterium]|nr:hypothetical protein [Lachnospiraceae bacterium]